MKLKIGGLYDAKFVLLRFKICTRQTKLTKVCTQSGYVCDSFFTVVEFPGTFTKISICQLLIMDFHPFAIQKVGKKLVCIAIGDILSLRLSRMNIV